MTNGIYVKRGRKTYKVVSGNCTKRTCSLFKAGVCDYEGEDFRGLKLPCLVLYRIADANGGTCFGTDANFKEVRNV